MDSPVAGGLGKGEQQLPEAGTPVSRDQREAGHKTNEEKPRNEIPGGGGVLYKALKRPRESRRSRADCSVTRRALGSPPLPSADSGAEAELQSPARARPGTRSVRGLLTPVLTSLLNPVAGPRRDKQGKGQAWGLMEHL